MSKVTLKVEYNVRVFGMTDVLDGVINPQKATTTATTNKTARKSAATEQEEKIIQ